MAVLVGRGALIKPWIWQELREGRELQPTAAERVGIYRQLVANMRAGFGDDALGEPIAVAAGYAGRQWPACLQALAAANCVSWVQLPTSLQTPTGMPSVRALTDRLLSSAQQLGAAISKHDQGCAASRQKGRPAEHVLSAEATVLLQQNMSQLVPCTGSTQCSCMTDRQPWLYWV